MTRPWWRVVALVLSALMTCPSPMAVGIAEAAAGTPHPAASSVSYTHDVVAYSYDSTLILSEATDEVPDSSDASHGPAGREASLQVKSVVISGFAVAANTASKVGSTTAHGAQRIAGAGATRGGVLAEDEILLVRDAGQLLTQADGAAVRVLQNEAGRFNVVVDGERGLITSFSNISQKSLARLGTRYGWE